MSHAQRSRWRGAGQTDIGLVRQDNQDAFFILDELGLWIIADGMGGHPGGNLASRIAVDTVAAHLTAHTGSGATQPGLSVDALRQAVMRANAALHAEGDAQPAYKGMGTTLTVLHVAGVSQAQATLVHVGDSRAYLHRAGALFQLTKDHSWVEDEVRAGRLSAQDAPAHPMRHVLTRALGIATQVEPEFLTLGLQAGDQLLLCTDGLTKMMNDEEIAATLARSNRHPQAACDALVREANERGGRDNVTVLIVGDHIM